jgi:putative membrane protein insertion efficiency factor
MAKNKSAMNIRLLSKLATAREIGGDSEQRTGVYRRVHEDSSTESTNKLSAEVAFRKKSIVLTAIRSLVLLPVYGYRYLVSPFLPMSCRFEPTCSAYAIEAIQTLGIFKGIIKTTFRLLRCHPWCVGGYDPVSPNMRYKKDDRY